MNENDQHSANRSFAIYVVRKLQNAGYEALWAGGCVRDALLNIQPKDYDVATNATPEQVCQMFNRTLTIGMAFGVVQVRGKNKTEVEVATFRSDGEYSDGRHPDAVTFSNAKEDAMRRDFTINGLFYDPIRESTIDYVNGAEDIEHGIVRAIGDPFERFREDKLRLLRAVRFAARYNFELEQNTYQAICAMRSEIHVVSHERIAAEWEKMLSHPNRSHACEYLKETQLFDELFPEWITISNNQQLWNRTIRLLSFWNDPIDWSFGMLCFLDSIDSSARIDVCLSILERLKVSNRVLNQLKWLCTNLDAFDSLPTRTKAYCKRLFANAHFYLLKEFVSAKAQIDQNEEMIQSLSFCDGLMNDWTDERINPDPILTGEDLIREGIKPGPQFGKLLESIREAQLNEEIFTIEEANAFLRKQVNS